LLLAWLASGGAIPAAGQVSSNASDRSVRTAVQEQALAVLDSERPLERSNGLIDILAGGDPVLRDAAIGKISASTDTNLKSILLRWTFSRPGKSYLFEFDQCGGSYGRTANDAREDCRMFVHLTSNAFLMMISITDPADGSFGIFSPKGTSLSYEGSKMWPGRVIGDRIVFSVDLANFSGGWSQTCAGSYKLNAEAQMVGTLTCGRLIVGGNFSIM
jgi:hypothetical protein